MDKNSFLQDIDQLLHKASEVNSTLLSEISIFLDQLSHSQEKDATYRKGSDFLTGIITSFAKLHIKHTTEFYETLIALGKQLNSDPPIFSSDTHVRPSLNNIPSFELKVEGALSEKVDFAFLLNNDQEKPYFCQVIASDFVWEVDQKIKSKIDISFSPNIFELVLGYPQRIDAHFFIPENMHEGVHKSIISIQGYEAVYFELLLTVSNGK